MKVDSHNKAELRRHYQKTREAMSPHRARTSSEAVCRHLSGWLPFVQAHTVLGFIAFRNEIDLGRLFEEWPDKRWLVPRVADGSELGVDQPSHLVLHPYDATRLVRHRFGMLEPAPDLPRVNPREVQMVLVPGVAFDWTGGRLGFGGGYYDRLLPSADRAITVGVTYEELVLDAVPTEPWDYRVEWLVTPAGLIKVRDQ
jgi:5-formyltetrahydrofolate cyclo-ligase